MARRSPRYRVSGRRLRVAAALIALSLTACGTNQTTQSTRPERGGLDGGAVTGVSDSGLVERDSGAPDSGAADAGTNPGEDASPWQPGSDTGVLPERDGGTVDPMTCTPNLDGRIDADELPFAAGVTVTYRVSPAGAERAVDLEPRGGAWDWSSDDRDDELVRISPSVLADWWFADAFPGGQFVAPVDADGTVQGIYASDASAVQLLGVASTRENPAEGRTLMRYETPVSLYRFPLADGAEWVSTGVIRDGELRGLPYAGRDVYETRVDGSGRLLLPDLTFVEAHRVRTRVTLQPAVGITVTRRQVSFLFECFGEVARATSRDSESEENFTIATEVRRLGL